jgi:hypothetical protein
MGVAPEDLPQFPVDAAEALAAERFRTTAGRLRDAAAEHEADKRQAVALR